MHTMKSFKLLFVLFITLFYSLISHSSYLIAQIYKPVKWSYSVNKLSGNKAELVFTAKIEKNWYLYSQDIPKGGPIPTSFKFNPSQNYNLIGNVTEQNPEIKQDDNFSMTLKVYHNSATFKQKVKILSANDFTVDGSLEFMCCNNQQCLPPEDVDFKFELNGVVKTPGSSQSHVSASVNDKSESVKFDSAQKTNQLSTINHQRSTINDQRSTINDQRSTTND